VRTFAVGDTFVHVHQGPKVWGHIENLGFHLKPESKEKGYYNFKNKYCRCNNWKWIWIILKSCFIPLFWVLTQMNGVH